MSTARLFFRRSNHLPGSRKRWLLNRNAASMAVAILLTGCALLAPWFAAAEDAPTLLQTWRGTNGDFLGPRGLCADSTGSVYVADTGRGRFQKFSSSGSFLAERSVDSDLAGPSPAPWDIAVGPDGHVYVSVGTHLLVYDASLAYERGWLGSVDMHSLAVDPTGQFIFATYSTNMYKYRISDGALLGSWQYSAGFPISLGFGVGPSGNLYVASSGFVQKFSTDGAFLGQWKPVGDAIAIAVDSQEHVYVTEGSAFAGKYDAAGTLLARWPVDGPDHVDLAVDGARNIYMLSSGAVTIYKFGNAAVPAVRKSWGTLKTLYR